MDGDISNGINVYGEAKTEFTHQLCGFIVPALLLYFDDLLKETKEKEKDTKRILWVFQNCLKEFPEWNVDKISRETEKIKSTAHCDYLEDILTAVFIAHTKILSAIRLTSKQKKIQITVPKLDHFLHRTMSECARSLWSNAYLFADNMSMIEKQKNLQHVERLLHEAVLQSIRGMLPVKNILRDYLNDEMDDSNTVAPVEEVAHGEEDDIIDISGGAVTVSAVVEEPIVVSEPPVVSEEPILNIDISGNNTVLEPPIQTIVIDSKPASVTFTNMDTVFDSNNVERNVIRVSEMEDSEEEVNEIEILDEYPPEPIDEYENLDDQDDSADKITDLDDDDFSVL